MAFNLDIWKEKATASLQHLDAWIEARKRGKGPLLLYGYLGSMSLLPLVLAAQGGDMASVWMAVGGLFGGVGGGLVANKVDAWAKQAADAQDAEALALALVEEVEQTPAFQAELDLIIEELDLIPQAQSHLSQTQQQWFVETLRQELAALGNLSRFEATLTGSGLIIQGSQLQGGDGAVVGSEVKGHVITGDGNSVTTIINYYLEQSQMPSDEKTVRRQIASYLTWMIDRYRIIELRGIKREGQQVVQLDLETVYVPLAAKTYDRAQPKAIALDQVLSQGRHIAITGGPGSGKTTVMLHLAYTLSQAIGIDSIALAAEKLGMKGDLPLPIFAPLSSYAHYLRDLPPGSSGESRTLAAFISDHLLRSQVPFELPGDFFQQLLRIGQHVILLLDGLDEVPTEPERAEVRQAIEALLTGREQMRVVVTCRTAAYKGRTALGKGFRPVEVLPLDAGHIEGLVGQAYADIYGHDRQVQQQKTTDLLQAIAKLEEQRRRQFGKKTEPLITSPLLVRMLLVVHYSERRLPDQRAELYMKATDAMLLPEYSPDEAVANRIGGLIGESQSVHRELAQHLAFAMHQRGETQGREIDEDELRQILDGHPSYGDLTAKFISLTRQRGTLLEERLGQYRFLHLAFQEYLTARYLAETLRSDSGLDSIAEFLEGGPILDSWWREPALLVVGYLSIGSPAIAQKLLRRLAGLDDQAGSRQHLADVHLATAELAGSAALEWPTIPTAVTGELAHRLATLMETPSIMNEAGPIYRAALGNTLARLGDPRPEVMTIEAMQFCYIPPGPFIMGSDDRDKVAYDDEKPQHEVMIDRGYWLGRYPVTVAQFRAFVEDSDQQLGDPDALRDPLNRPVRYVTWHEALAFCRWLAERWQQQGRLPAGWQVMLPSEAEWEKAARGGLTIPATSFIVSLDDLDTAPDLSLIDNPAQQRRFPWGDETDPNRANYDESGIGTTSPVGCFPGGVSPYGCEEMSGNVWEWTRSHYKDYPYDLQDDRENLKAGNDVRRVVRGGAFSGYERSVRCAYRSYNPSGGYGSQGFRVSLVASPLTSDL